MNKNFIFVSPNPLCLFKQHVQISQNLKQFLFSGFPVEKANCWLYWMHMPLLTSPPPCWRNPLMWAPTISLTFFILVFLHQEVVLVYFHYKCNDGVSCNILRNVDMVTTPQITPKSQEPLAYGLKHQTKSPPSPPCIVSTSAQIMRKMRKYDENKRWMRIPHHPVPSEPLEVTYGWVLGK